MTKELSVPFVAGIIERVHGGKRQLLLQTRFKPHVTSIYNGTFEFAAGQLDKPFENVYKAIAREIKEETGLTLKAIIGDSQTEVFTPHTTDASFGFRPFCCVQQLRGERAWVGFIFRCQVEDGDPVSQPGETKDVHWEDYDVVKELFEKTPKRLFTLEIPAWSYYFQEATAEA